MIKIKLMFVFSIAIILYIIMFTSIINKKKNNRFNKQYILHNDDNFYVNISKLESLTTVVHDQPLTTVVHDQPLTTTVDIQDVTKFKHLVIMVPSTKRNNDESKRLLHTIRSLTQFFNKSASYYNIQNILVFNNDDSIEHHPDILEVYKLFHNEIQFYQMVDNNSTRHLFPSIIKKFHNPKKI